MYLTWNGPQHFPEMLKLRPKCWHEMENCELSLLPRNLRKGSEF